MELLRENVVNSDLILYNAFFNNFKLRSIDNLVPARKGDVLLLFSRKVIIYLSLVVLAIVWVQPSIAAPSVYTRSFYAPTQTSVTLYGVY